MAVTVNKNDSTSYHTPRTASELTERNIAAIAQLEEAADAKRSHSDVIADRIANFCGSMKFVWVHLIWFGFWIVWNEAPGIKHPDPFPFSFLTLVVSLEAIFLTTFVMISQNRQGRLADRRNHLDLQINLLAEQENSKMLTMLKALLEHAGIDDGDPEVHILEEATQPDKLVEQIEKVMEKSVTAEDQESQNQDRANT